MGETQLKDFLQYDAQLKKDFPKRSDNIEAHINVPSSSIPLGISKITSTTNAKMASHVYFSEDQKRKLSISEGNITYTDEQKYICRENFEQAISKCLSIFSPILEKHIIVRTSIRFINQFLFEDFSDPTQYFRTLISSTGNFAYPLMKYGFKLMLGIEENIYSIVNQNIDKVSDKYIYIFDIDVLDKRNLIYDVKTIINVLQNLRVIKNQIFFNNITEKTIDLCS